jgi:hypothetical protein
MAHIHIPDSIPTRYLQKSQSWNLLTGGLILVGAVAFFMTLGRDADQAWRAYIVNWLLFTSVATGACIVAVVTWIVKAKWNWSLRRISISFVAFLPVAFVLMFPMLTLGGDYFPWVEMMATDPIVQKKAAYLNVPFLVARNLIGFLVMMGMLMYFAANAVRPDMGLVADDGNESRRKTQGWFKSKWLGQAEEEAASYAKMTRIAPPIVMVYAIVMSMISIDWIMSLEPHWFSTLFGGWFFMGAFWAGWSVTALVTVFIKRTDPEFDEMAGSQQLWDIGKLMFAFTVFWTYLFWSQYLVIWYGKLPWEQAWMITRSEAPWAKLSLVVIFMCFIFPFAALLGKKPKMNPTWLGTVAVVILCGQWLWQYVMLVPAIHHGGPAITLWEPAIGLMFLGFMIGSVRWFLSTFPIVQIWQPLPDPEFIEAEIGMSGLEMVNR